MPIIRLALTRFRPSDAKSAPAFPAVAADDGFTLVELLVVLLVIGVLLGIAIPTFLGVTTSAGDTATKANIKEALQVEQEYYVSNEAYTSDVSQLSGIEPSLGWESAGQQSSMALKFGEIGVYTANRTRARASTPSCSSGSRRTVRATSSAPSRSPERTRRATGTRRAPGTMTGCARSRPN